MSSVRVLLLWEHGQVCSVWVFVGWLTETLVCVAENPRAEHHPAACMCPQPHWCGSKARAVEGDCWHCEGERLSEVLKMLMIKRLLCFYLMRSLTVKTAKLMSSGELTAVCLCSSTTTLIEKEPTRVLRHGLPGLCKWRHWSRRLGCPPLHWKRSQHCAVAILCQEHGTLWSVRFSAGS